MTEEEEEDEFQRAIDAMIERVDTEVAGRVDTEVAERVDGEAAED